MRFFTRPLFIALALALLTLAAVSPSRALNFRGQASALLDPLTKALLSAPPPADASRGERMDKPDLYDNDKPEPGELAEIIVSSFKGGDAFVFTVFWNADEARASYAETIKSDRGQAKAFGGSVAPVPGATGICLLKGSAAVACRALAGRVTISLLYTEKQPQQAQAFSATRATVKYVSGLER